MGRAALVAAVALASCGNWNFLQGVDEVYEKAMMHKDTAPQYGGAN